MICLKRNKQKIWYANYLGQTPIVDVQGYETGESRATYTEPTAIEVNVSPATGMTRISLFGDDLTYDKVIVSEDRHLLINENSILWVEADPETEPYDYVVRRVARSLNGCAVAISRVEVKP